MKTIIRLVIILFILTCAASAGGYFYLKSLFQPVALEPFYHNVKIAPGSSVAEIGRALNEKGVIKSQFAFWFYVKMNGFDSKLKAGDYAFSADWNIEQIVKKLIAGETQNITLTVPEGFSLEELRLRLKKYNIMDENQFNTAANDPELLKSLPYQLDTIEGVLFPETYIFNKSAKPGEILKMMVKEFKNKLPKDTDEQLKKLGRPFREVLIMASLVEKEARHDEDRAKIASVFYNRLAKQMKLESCATVQYILGENRKSKLLYSDLQVDSPFNTYKNKGLPPAPICSPSKKSIMAALNPETTDYLFFVAKPDGYHIFSKNFADHTRGKQTSKKLGGEKNGDN
ncbi:MAG TPA: endolytic transglycosylase MltG [Candidatus Wallbacteria bacterium]|nr:MAG: putative aminodeoxychorismate lyase [bacterium ADurb.Bin243]HPG58140.1 endolytic transglycosylase MltG [Candidatus Wallbacteria bacterium]